MSIATYFLMDVFPNCCLISSARLTFSGSSADNFSDTVAFCRFSISTPFSCTQLRSCAELFGFSNPVNFLASFSRRAVLCSLTCSAPSINAVSTFTPNAFMRISICHNFSSSSGTGKASSLRRISLSVTTSCLQYSLNNSHFSGACLGRFHVLFPLLFVGLHGTQKYRIKAFPVASFLLSCGSPIAFPVASSPAVYPQ